MSLHHKFDENMKGDSKLLIIEATFGFYCFANFLVKRYVGLHKTGGLWKFSQRSHAKTAWLNIGRWLGPMAAGYNRHDG